VAINGALQLEDAKYPFNHKAHNAPAYKFNNSTRDVSAFDENLCVFGQIYTAHAQKLQFIALGQSSDTQLDLAIQISYMIRRPTFWPITGIYYVLLIFDHLILTLVSAVTW